MGLVDNERDRYKAGFADDVSSRVEFGQVPDQVAASVTVNPGRWRCRPRLLPNERPSVRLPLREAPWCFNRWQVRRLLCGRYVYGLDSCHGRGRLES